MDFFREEPISGDAKTTNKKVLAGEKTVESLLVIATKAFAKRGYNATTTQDIIKEGNVTKGALYHHFPSKLLLFEAVYRSIETKVAKRIDAASAQVNDPWGKLVAGCEAYLEAFLEPGWARILRADGPSTLGLDRWREIDQEYGLGRLLPFLQHLSDQGILNVPSVEAFAHILTGAMNGATFWIAEFESPKIALAESKAMLAALLSSCRSSPPGGT